MLEKVLNRKFYMADEGEGGYGYGDDTDAKVSPFNFGLMAGVTKLKKFEWIANGGKDGAEQEALDIIFDINGTERGYRQFPVVKAFGKNNEEITDKSAPEFKLAVSEFNAKITHILHAYVEDAVIKQAFARKIANFKEFCNIAKSLFPKDTPNIALDVFMQYQWTLREGQSRTFLELPSKRKHGSFICKAQPGTWTAIKVENPEDSNQFALRYGKEETAIKHPEVKDANGNVTQQARTEYTEFHPFVRTGWFMNSNFAIQQRGEGGEEESSEGAAAMNSSDNLPPVGDTPVASTW